MRPPRTLDFGSDKDDNRTRNELRSRGIRALEVAATLGALRHLEHLSLAHTRIPHSTLPLANLLSLDLSGFLHLSLPASQLPHCESLVLRECQLSALPPGVEDMHWLRRLDLSGNFKFRLPASLAQTFPRLEELHVWGHLPDNAAAVTSLRILEVRHDKTLSPAFAWAALTALESLALWDCGPPQIPSALAQLPRLRALALCNYFGLVLPAALPPHLDSLDLTRSTLEPPTAPAAVLLRSLTLFRPAAAPLLHNQTALTSLALPHVFDTGPVAYPAALPLLQSLDLSKNTHTQHIQLPAVPLPALRTLKLDCHVALPLRNMPRLRSLTLGARSAVEFVAAARAGELAALEELFWAGSFVSDPLPGDALAQLPRMRTAVLAFNDVLPLDGVAAVLDAGGWPRLRLLDVRGVQGGAALQGRGPRGCEVMADRAGPGFFRGGGPFGGGARSVAALPGFRAL